MKQSHLRRGVLAVFVMSLGMFASLQAGSRGMVIGITNITQGEQGKECKRLFELLQMDATFLFVKAQGLEWAWEADSTEIKAIPSGQTRPLFGKMIILKNKAGLQKISHARELYEGVIVFEYDKAAMKARLKLFDGEGKELVLIKLPLEPGGAMRHSLLRHVRRGALSALGNCVEFSP